MTRRGVLLINLGTPDEPRVPAVRRYLREFLSDPLVIDVNPLGRWLLVNLIIAPFRSPRATEAYAKIWSAEGSPLLVNSRRFAERVQERLPGDEVVLAMRYGNPSLRDAVGRLVEAGCDEVVVLPLYPQYALSSTESSLVAVRREAQALGARFRLREVQDFFDDAGFLDAWAEVGREALAGFEPDHVLFSYHGLPERHITKLDAFGHCFSGEDFACCAAVGERNRLCYRAQCVATTRGIVERLGLEPARCTTSFQSRLGRTVWIGPYTDVLVEELARAGTRRLAVFCPSFVADCLETLEEIGLRADEAFRAAGGERLVLVPSLNAHERWADAAAALIRCRTLFRT